MTVLLLGPYPPPHGGVQTNLIAIRDLLRRSGHRCLVMNLYRHRTGRGEYVYHPEGAWQALRLLIRLRYDVLHLHMGGAVTARLVALCFACTLMPAKTVLTFHSGGYASSPKGMRARPRSLRGFAFRRFDRVIVVNTEMAELFGRFGLPPSKIRLIPPHVLPPKALDTELPGALCGFVQAHRPLLVTVGQIEPEYDLPLQIGVLGRVRERFPRAGLAILGSGSLEAELRARISALPWAEHILLCGDIEHAATLRAIAGADALLRTTHYDGDSIAVREALHLGTPVIATDNRMRPPGVRLVPVRDPDALYRAIEECLSEPGREKVPAEPGACEDHIQAVLELYRELVA